MKSFNLMILLLASISLSGCFRVGSNQRSLNGEGSNSSSGDLTPPGGGGSTGGGNTTVQALPPNAVVAANHQVLRDMKSKTGVSLSAEAYDRILNSNSSNFSTSGDQSTINAPMDNAVTAAAGEYCRVLVDGNNALFAGLNLGGNPAQLTNPAFSNSIEAQAKAFWGRLPSSVEVNLITNAKSEMIQGGSTNSRNIMAAICTAMLSSASGLVR